MRQNTAPFENPWEKSKAGSKSFGIVRATLIHPIKRLIVPYQSRLAGTNDDLTMLVAKYDLCSVVFENTDCFLDMLWQQIIVVLQDKCIPSAQKWLFGK